MYYQHEAAATESKQTYPSYHELSPVSHQDGHEHTDAVLHWRHHLQVSGLIVLRFGAKNHQSISENRLRDSGEIRVLGGLRHSILSLEIIRTTHWEVPMSPKICIYAYGTSSGVRCKLLALLGQL